MIASLHNPLVKHLVKLREERKYREEQGSVLVTGYKLVKEIAAYTPPRKLFIENPTDAFGEGEIYSVNHAVLKKITGLPSPEPIAAEFPIPAPSPLTGKMPLLVLDAIRDPGNLGTLIRTALALGWGGVFFLPTCVDPFHEKALRASRAAPFRLPWRRGTWEELAYLRQAGNLTAYIADMQGTPLNAIRPTPHTLLLLSNEAQGLGKQAEAFGQKIAVPMKGNMESLNVAVAGAILMYHLIL